MPNVRVCRNGNGQIPVTPSETDLATQVLASGVNVFFRPTTPLHVHSFFPRGIQVTSKATNEMVRQA
jgi:hypothetical protein